MRSRRRVVSSIAHLPLDSVTTKQLLDAHERLFGPLEPASKQRLLARARGRARAERPPWLRRAA